MPDARPGAAAEPTEADRRFVEEVMSRSGISPSAEELVRLTRSYRVLRTGADELYEVPEARYEVPALVFDPAPGFHEWGS